MSIEKVLAETDYSMIEDELVLGSPDSDIIDLLMEPSSEDQAMRDILGDDNILDMMIDLEGGPSYA